MRILQRKPYSQILAISESNDGYNHKSLTEYSLFDLICVGVGATLGSGVFVLTGLVAREYAGPSAFFSWIIAGIACCFSAMSYAEMSNRFPSAGSAYTFVYSTLGELPAYIAGWCLTLECGMSAAAVARNWGVKILNYSHTNQLKDEFGFNLYAFSMMVGTVILFLTGTEVSKLTINLFTVLKVLLVFFMIIGGFCLFRPSNIVTSFAPMGIHGCLRGATSCFFGFVGFDEVCCLALESKNAKRHLPLAVFGTIALVTLLYAFSSLSLTGMESYYLIDSQSGFSKAFSHHGYRIAAGITAMGEILTLPLVVIVSFLPQARISFAMASDGLCPAIFSYRSNTGNFTYGIIYGGLMCTLVAAFVPFAVLNDIISAGVLFSFNLTNNSLLITRCEIPDDIPWPQLGWNRCQVLLSIFNVQCCFISVLMIIQVEGFLTELRWIAVLLGSAFAVLTALSIQRDCAICEPMLLRSQSSPFPYSEIKDNGLEEEESVSEKSNDRRGEEDYLYRVPLMPYPPLIGLFLNYFLIAQLSMRSFLGLIGYFLLAIATYFLTRR